MEQLLFKNIEQTKLKDLQKLTAVLTNQVYQQQCIINELQKKKTDINIPVKTLFDAMKDFLTYSKHNHTINSYKKNISMKNRIFSFFNQEENINNITSKKIEEYKRYRKQQKTHQGKITSNATINRELAMLKAVLNREVAAGNLIKNPFQNVNFFKEDQVPRKFLSKEDVNKILNFSYNNKLYAHYKPMVYIAIFAGLRLREILNLKWEDVNLKNKSILVRKSKSHKIRYIPIPAQLFEFLKNYKQQTKFNKPDDYVVYYNGKKINTIHKGWKNLLKKIGIKTQYRFHDLRHTFASYLVMNNVDITTVQNLLGHSDVKTTMRYSHVNEIHKIKAVETLKF